VLVPLSLHYRYTVVALLLYCFTLLLHFCYTAITLLLHFLLTSWRGHWTTLLACWWHTTTTVTTSITISPTALLVLDADGRLPCVRVGGTRGVAQHIRISIKGGPFFGTVVSHWCYSGSTVVLLWCYMLRWRHSHLHAVALSSNRGAQRRAYSYYPTHTVLTVLLL
jgi:hypothetical protein